MTTDDLKDSVPVDVMGEIAEDAGRLEGVAERIAQKILAARKSGETAGFDLHTAVRSEADKFFQILGHMFIDTSRIENEEDRRSLLISALLHFYSEILDRIAEIEERENTGGGAPLCDLEECRRIHELQ